jgi:RND superfamily putative drug exporter
MTMLGKWNWWLPAWLDRLLPKLEVDKDDADLWGELDDAGLVADDEKVGA